MRSTIHLRTNQILSPGGGGVGEGSEDFFLGKGWQMVFRRNGGGGISRRQLSITVGLLTIDSQ